MLYSYAFYNKKITSRKRELILLKSIKIKIGGKMRVYRLKTGEELIIRKAYHEDVEELLNCINRCGKETNFLRFGEEGIGISIEEYKKQIENFTNKNFMLVAIIEGVIVGSCSLRTIENRLRVAHRSSIGISILQDYSGKGIGKCCFDFLIEEAKKNNITKLELEVRADNERAINLYKKMGFEIEGKLRNSIYIDGEYLDSYIMGKII